jgi:prepilin-type N-terminal cleavage/methylation domain-containing protein
VNPSRGFTLIEVLVAILVVGVVLPVALTGVGRALQAAGRSAREGTARRLAASLEARLLASGDWRTTATSGAFDPAQDGAEGAGFRWQAALASGRIDTLRTLTITVLRADGDGTALCTRTTLLPAGGG